MKDGKVAAIWRHPLPDARERLWQRTAAALAKAPAGPVRVFFRADDVAVPGKNLTRLAGLFQAYQVPLALAVVPAWLTDARWRQLRQTFAGTALWCFHQHGWRHRNHEPEGKKAEFGPARPAEAIRRDLASGRRRLEGIMGERFCPVFTPPWNRAGEAALEALQALSYRAVSTSGGRRPPAPAGLPDLAVQVDLHTRRETDPRAGWERLFAEWEGALAGGICGVMLHHQRMNPAAFGFLACLLELAAGHPGLVPVHFRDLLENERAGG